MGESSIWDDIKFPPAGGNFEISPVQLLGIPLLKRALKGGPPLLYGYLSGSFKGDPEVLITELCSLLRVSPVIETLTNRLDRGTTILGSDVLMIRIEIASQGDSAVIAITTSSRELLAKAKEYLLERVLEDSPDDGVVYALGKTSNGYQLDRIGAAGVVLQRPNYTPEVLKGYDHVVQDLNSESPCGRLIILSGEPGTGKTFLTRALLRECPGMTSVLVPPTLIQHIGEPDLMPSLLQVREGRTGSLLLVLEDADMCLVPRGADNMSSISSLLNLGDGILGSLLDIRILATTNAKKIQMDEAAKRKGRLCQHLEVGKLHSDQATELLTKLIASVDPDKVTGEGISAKFREHASLADVYAKAREFGWVPPPKKAPPVENRPILGKAYRR